MIYIKTTLEAYQNYVKVNNTDRIKKGEKLIIGNTMTNKHPLYEIKYNPLYTTYKTNIETDENGYEIILCVFNCFSDNLYRIDLVEIEPENYWLNNRHYNISFTLVGNEDIHNNLTQLGELYELFMRIMFVLNDINKLGNNYVYVIGDSFDKRKNLLYKDFIGNFGDADVNIGESSLFETGNITYYVRKK